MAKRKSPTKRTAADIVSPQDGGPIEGNDQWATTAWKHWRQSRTHLSKWLSEAKNAYDIVAGRQWTTDEEAALKEQLRPIVTFNRTGVICDAVSGYEINNRQDVTYLPREVEDTGPVQVENEAAKYYRGECDAEDEETDGFFDCLVCGVGAIEHHMDYDDDPEGMLKVERGDPLEFGWDPSATKRNLLDRKWDVRGKWWDKKEAKEKWPDHDFSDGNNIAGDTDELSMNQAIDRDAAIRYEDTGINGEQQDRRKDEVFIIEHTWFEKEAFISYADPISQKLVDTDPDKFKGILQQLQALATATGQQFQTPKSVKRMRKVFKRVFVHGKDTLNKDDMEAPCKHRFHYQFMTGKRDRNQRTWYGLVRPMKDPQEWANKFMSQTMHMINSNAKGGLIHDEGAFENEADVEKRMAKPGWRIPKRPGHEVVFVPPTPIPNNTFDLMTFAISSGRDVTGVNVELLGLADRDQPGVLEDQRKRSAMAILAPFFNAIRRYRKEAGRLTLYFIKEYMSDGRKIRIVGQGKAQYVPLTNEMGFDKFDVIVDQSPSSPDGKRAVFAILAQMMPVLAKAGVMPPPDILDYIPDLPAEFVQKWKEQLAKPNPQAEMAQQLEMADKKADVDKKTAEAAKIGAEAQNVGNEAQVQAAEQMSDMQLQQQQMQFEREKMGFERVKMAYEIRMKELELAATQRAQAHDEAMGGMKIAGEMNAQEHDRQMGDVAIETAKAKATAAAERPNAAN
jgi:hypothetical protein